MTNFVVLYDLSCCLCMPHLESEQNLMSESQELKAQLTEVRGELSASQRRTEDLVEQLQSIEADYVSYRTHSDGTLQDAQKEMESLKVKLSMKEGELEVSNLDINHCQYFATLHVTVLFQNEAMEKQALAEKVAQLENERQQLSVS